MLTYSFDKMGNECLYIYLYECIKKDILAGRLKPDEKLPSKRSFAKHLGVSAITVENAYLQLQSEGFLYTLPRRGFYVTEINPVESFFTEKAEFSPKIHGATAAEPEQKNLSKQADEFTSLPMGNGHSQTPYVIDLVSNKTAPGNFPFSIWAKMVREILMEQKEELMVSPPAGGIMELRNAIAGHLKAFRNMTVDPKQIIIGAGTEYLYGLIIELLGNQITYAFENPGYIKLEKIYEAKGMTAKPIPLDAFGITPETLEESGANVAHISPSHHFPTGKIMPVSRRYEILAWASRQKNRYILEDDYDSEFRMTGKPVPTLQSIDQSEKVIYINTFSKTLSSTVRMGYMVLPAHLLEVFQKNLSFYSCTVSNFEQYTLARFLSGGYFEKHINRMRTHYKNIRNQILEELKKSPFSSQIEILEENAGLHFLLRIHTEIPDWLLKEQAAEKGLHLAFLSEYYFHDKNVGFSEEIPQHILVINYSGLTENDIKNAVVLLGNILS